MIKQDKIPHPLTHRPAASQSARKGENVTGDDAPYLKSCYVPALGAALITEWGPPGGYVGTARTAL